MRKIARIWHCCGCDWLSRLCSLPLSHTHTHMITSFFPSKFADFLPRSVQSGICCAAEAQKYVICYSRLNQEKGWLLCRLSASGADLSGPSTATQEPECCCPAQASQLLPFSQYGSGWQFLNPSNERFQWILWKIRAKISLPRWPSTQHPWAGRFLSGSASPPSSLLSHFLSLSFSSKSQI